MRYESTGMDSCRTERGSGYGVQCTLIKIAGKYRSQQCSTCVSSAVKASTVQDMCKRAGQVSTVQYMCPNLAFLRDRLTRIDLHRSGKLG